MLGCHDFCGYYEWTFGHVRRCWGHAAVQSLWADAIGGESQRHYTEAARRAGLRGLYDTWSKTGQDEACDWTFTLHEERNVLRCDMRACPSKGFLIQNDLNADEDYCDHCMGWVIPLLDKIGAEVLEHEHNHCGQCWMTLAMKDRPAQPVPAETDIRRDPRWNHGYLDRWERGRKQPLVPELSESSDGCDVLHAWFAGAGAGAVLMADSDYLASEVLSEVRPGVLIGQPPADLGAVARRFLATPPGRRPLLMHTYLPAEPPVDFVSWGLPRPMPILPLLIRKGLYRHHPGGPHPTAAEFLRLLSIALGAPLEPPRAGQAWPPGL